MKIKLLTLLVITASSWQTASYAATPGTLLSSYSLQERAIFPPAVTTTVVNNTTVTTVYVAGDQQRVLSIDLSAPSAPSANWVYSSGVNNIIAPPVVSQDKKLVYVVTQAPGQWADQNLVDISALATQNMLNGKSLGMNKQASWNLGSKFNFAGNPVLAASIPIIGKDGSLYGLAATSEGWTTYY